MRQSSIVRDPGFEEIAEVKTDSKNRITLGRKGAPAGSRPAAVYYKVYRNPLGQIILDPLVTIPAHEQWLFKNKEAAQAVQSGLEDAKKGRLVKAREDYSKYAVEED